MKVGTVEKTQVKKIIKGYKEIKYGTHFFNTTI